MKSFCYAILIFTLLFVTQGYGSTIRKEEKPSQKTATVKRWENPSNYFTDDIVAAIVIRPKQIWDSPAFQKSLKSAFSKESVKKFEYNKKNSDAPYDPGTMKQLIVLVNKKSVAHTVNPNGSKMNSSIPRELFAEKTRKDNSNTPLLIFHFSKQYDKVKLLKSISAKPQAVNNIYSGTKQHRNIGVHIIDDKTFIAGSEDFLKKILLSKGSQSKVTKQFIALKDDIDFGFVANLEPVKKDLKKLIESRPPVPVVRAILNLKTISLEAKMTGKKGETLFSFHAEALTTENAKFIALLLNGMIETGKIQFDRISKEKHLSQVKEFVAMKKELYTNLKFTNKKEHLFAKVPIPKGYDKIPEMFEQANKIFARKKKEYARKFYKERGLAKVTGTITMNGKPLPNATVTFQVQRDKNNPRGGRPSVGVTDANGKYELHYIRGVMGGMAGQHRVHITTLIEDEDSNITTPEKVAPQFNNKSTLKVKVKAGENTIDFNVKPIKKQIKKQI